jgi:hypothetical protein
MISSFAQLASHGGGGRLVPHLAAAVGCWWWWWWCGLSVAGSHGHPPTPKQSSNKKTCFSKTHQQKSKALDLRLFCDLGYVLENMLLLDATCAFPHTQPAVARAASYWYVASLDP